MKTTLIIGADHAGFALKERLVAELQERGFGMIDATPTFVQADDYPDIGMRVARLAAKKHLYAVLVCRSGVGMAIAANRIKGARAFVGHDTAEIKRARNDDHANILAIGAGRTSFPMALGMIRVFLGTKASKASRHLRRVKKLG